MAMADNFEHLLPDVAPFHGIRKQSSETIEFAARELRGMAQQFRRLRSVLPEIAEMSRCQLDGCVDMLEQRAAKIQYDHCEHEFKTVTQPGTPNGLAEHFSVCEHCGSERLEDQ